MNVQMNHQGLGRQIRRRRKAQGLTQEDLAKRASISLSFLGHIERGSRKASVETLVYIAAALGVSPDALLIDTIDPDNMGSMEHELREMIASVYGVLNAIERWLGDHKET